MLKIQKSQVYIIIFPLREAFKRHIYLTPLRDVYRIIWDEISRALII